MVERDGQHSELGTWASVNRVPLSTSSRRTEGIDSSVSVRWSSVRMITTSGFVRLSRTNPGWVAALTPSLPVRNSGQSSASKASKTREAESRPGRDGGRRLIRPPIRVEPAFARSDDITARRDRVWTITG